MKTKNKSNQILGILEEFEQEDVKQALMNTNYIEELLSELENDNMIFIKAEESQLPKECREDPDNDDPNIIDYEQKAEASHFERLILPENNFLPVHFLHEGVSVSKAVAQVRTPRGRASGFLVSWNLFLTNNHVFPDKRTAGSSRVVFNFQDDYNGNAQSEDVYTCNPNSFFYTNPGLDFTLVRLNSKYLRRLSPRPARPVLPRIPEEWTEDLYAENMDELELQLNQEYANEMSIPFFPVAPGRKWGYLQLKPGNTVSKGQHVNIVQHPKGRKKEIVVQHNHIDKIERHIVKYKTDTDLGSSGSPVFDNEWDLVSLHHAGGDRHPRTRIWLNNEGIRITSIVRDLISKLSRSPAGISVLRQLGLR